MPKLFLHIILLISLSPAHAAQHRTTLFVNGIPALAYSMCTSFLIRRPYVLKPLAVTATHCVDYNGRFSKNTYVSGAILGIPNLTNRAYSFTNDFSEYSKARDLFMNQANNVSPQVKTLKIADKLPRRGDRISVEGYPGYGIPLIGNAAFKTRFHCTYQGDFIFRTRVNNLNEALTAMQLAKCDDSFFVEGASGGPVFDSTGKVIGVLSQYLSKDQIGNGQHNYFYFSSLTEQDYQNSSNVLVPTRNGRHTFMNANILVDNPEGPRPLKILKINYSVNLLSDVFHGTGYALDDNGNVINEEHFEFGQPK